MWDLTDLCLNADHYNFELAVIYGKIIGEKL